jgi:hypothetical protein
VQGHKRDVWVLNRAAARLWPWVLGLLVAGTQPAAAAAAAAHVQGNQNQELVWLLNKTAAGVWPWILGHVAAEHNLRQQQQRHTCWGCIHIHLLWSLRNLCE